MSPFLLCDRIAPRAPRPCMPQPDSVDVASTERSAARLAHQSGGLGVPSSNLGAPTNRFKNLARIDLLEPNGDNLHSRPLNSAKARPPMFGVCGPSSSSRVVLV